MMNISQIFEEHGTNIILLDSDLGTTFDIVKIDEETFELREMFTSYIEDCLPEETKENYILKIADVNDLERFDDGEYYLLVLHEICHIKRFELFKGI
nr:MAG TPA: putative protease-like protein [Ackermannviridae sp.]